jgi:hypothetical protein
MKSTKTSFVDTFGKESPSYATMIKRAAELKRVGRALEMMSGMGGQKRPPMMKLPKLCMIWSCAIEGETDEALLGKCV